MSFSSKYITHGAAVIARCTARYDERVGAAAMPILSNVDIKDLQSSSDRITISGRTASSAGS